MGVCLFLFGCTQTIPYTNRKAVNLIPQNEMHALGQRSFEDIRARSRVSQDPAALTRVQRVGQRLAAVIRTRERFEFHVFEDDKNINAFALPGGKVVVYTGILQLTHTDDELAIVLGHEIAHVTARHSNERLSQQMLMGALSSGLSMAMEGKQSRAAVMGVFGAGTQMGIMLPFSRTHELEADRMGTLYAAQAGYDPEAALAFWKRMGQASQGRKPPEFLSTHPSDGRRLEYMRSVCIPQAKAHTQKSSPQATHSTRPLKPAGAPLQSSI